MFDKLKSFWSEKFIPAFKEFRNSNNKFRVLVKYKKAILVMLATLTVVFGLTGYAISSDSTGLEVINNTAGLFVFAWADDDSLILDFAKFMALVTMFFGAIMLYLSNRANAYEIERIQEDPYTLLVGLGEQNRTFLNQLSKAKKDVLIIESDSNNKYIEEVKTEGFGVIISRAEDTLDRVNLTNIRECIISTGNDRRNIAIGLLLIEKLDNRHKKLFIRIENRDLSVLFKQDVIKSKNNTDIITYSLYENMTKALFAKHTVLGLQPEIAEDNKTFSTVVVGSSPLAVEIVYTLSMLSVLPNENKFILHLVSPDATAFYSRLQKLFANISKIPHLEIRCTEIEYDDLAFYQNKVWNSRNLTNVIVATDNEEQNLDIAINLQDTTYLSKSVKGTLKTKVLFALYHDLGLSRVIDENRATFANFYTFGNIREASSIENLLDERLDSIAKWANFFYAKMYGGVDKDIEWMKASMHDRLSTKAQVQHIYTKLVALSLSAKRSDKSYDTLLKENRELFNKRVETNLYGAEPIDTFKVEEFPQEFTSTLDKLAKAEHNRWNAFHYLHGWKYAKKRNKPLKEHHCLLPLEQFDNDDLKDTYRHDITSIVNIPLYLAQAGYELVEINR